MTNRKVTEITEVDDIIRSVAETAAEDAVKRLTERLGGDRPLHELTESDWKSHSRQTWDSAFANAEANAPFKRQRAMPLGEYLGKNDDGAA